jgi:DNA-binding transcriptional ArsR family regulator
VVADADIATPAVLIGDTTRAAFLMALADGTSLPASELAQRAGVSASTASIQLAKLIDGGLVAAEQHGRHRYYTLHDPAIANALESLAAIAPPQRVRSRKQTRIGSDLRAARTCYDHLAGVLGVSLLDALLESGALTEELVPTARGARRFRELGIDVDALARGRRPLGRRCLDWSERRHHLAGALGAALATRFFELGWVERTRSSRAVRVTKPGRRALARELGVELG